MFLPVDSNDNLWPACLRLRIALSWLKNLSSAKTKGALTVVCTPILKSVLGQRNNESCIYLFIKIRNVNIYGHELKSFKTENKKKT